MKYKFDVKGMTCASCQGHVQKAVEDLNGTSSVNVNLLQNTMEVDINERMCSVNKVKEAVSNAGYSASLQNEKKEEIVKDNDHSLRALIISIVFLLVLMYFSMGNMMWGWKTFPIFDMKENPMGFALIQFILVLPIVYIERKYFINGFKRLIKRSPNMDSLICIGASFSLLYGIYALFMISWGVATNNASIVEQYHMSLYFESAGMILVFVSIGKYLESFSKRKTTKALEKLMDLQPKKALVLRDDKEVLLPIEDVEVNDIVIVKKGDVVPVDGKIIEGKASFDQSNITGESLPVLKEVNDDVYSSTIQTAGYCKIKALKVGENTSISNIIHLVEEASNSKAPISKLADKISYYFVPIILLIALAAFIANFVYIKIANPSYVTNAFETALNFALTIIVIACPCALGLATPVAIMVGTGKGALNGLLIKNAEILEKAHNIKTIVLDKTGTITNGKPSVVDFIEFEENKDIYNIIYSLEIKSEHPLASSIVEFSKNKKDKDLNVTNYEALDGKGVRGVIDSITYAIGNEKMSNEIDISIQEKINEFAKSGKTPLLVFKENKAVAILAIKDEVKENSKLAINELKKQGIEVIMLTGDNEKTANKIANEVGINKVIANVLPTDKARVIKSLKKDDKHLVAMVGDGVNDALALTTADLGIAIGGGSQIAIESADIVLLRNDLLDCDNAIKLSKRVLNTIKLGLFWAFFYNIICVILSTGIFYYLSNGSFKMQPMYGSIAMSISSVSVVLNALTINLFKVKRNNVDIKEKENMDNKVVINVNGMMCMHCVKHVEDACLKVNGVNDAKASLENKNVTIICDSNTNIDEVKKNITEAGYEVK